MTEAVIRAQGLGKRYRVGERERYLALRDLITRTIAAPFRRSEKRQKDFLWALRDVSFDVKQGEVVGLIGRNGAGKSTLLKVLSRITKPTSGWAEVRGRVGSLLEVGTGFHPELTGRENVYLSGAILGMKRAEINRKFDQIVAFAEVERFLDSPLKHFSTGMQMRLAFAVAAHLDPEILLVDEVLAVGDIEFQKKCLGKMSEVSKGGRTIIFVSHQMSQIRRLCERVIWVDQGNIVGDGSAADVIAVYEIGLAERSRTLLEATHQNGSSAAINFASWRLLGASDASMHSLRHFGPVSFSVLVRLPERIHRGIYGLLLENDRGRVVWHSNWTLYDLGAGVYEFVHRMPMLPLLPGSYRWRMSIYDGHRWSDPWPAWPPLAVGTQPLTNAADEFGSVLNIACEFEPRSMPAPVEETR